MLEPTARTDWIAGLTWPCRICCPAFWSIFRRSAQELHPIVIDLYISCAQEGVKLQFPKQETSDCASHTLFDTCLKDGLLAISFKRWVDHLPIASMTSRFAVSA